MKIDTSQMTKEDLIKLVDTLDEQIYKVIVQRDTLAYTIEKVLGK